MFARSSHILATCGCMALLILGACKSDTPVTPSNSLEPIPTPLGPLSLGDVVKLNVNIEDPCTNPVYHGARVVAISSRAIILNDTLNPANGFTTADFQRFATRFDTLVYPLDVAAFGDPLDIDKNGHIAIVFTRAVNELTPARSNQYVGGVTFSRDLFPNTATSRAQACAGSNQGEYFYMLTPDPSGTINQNVRTAGFVDSNTVAVIAHEFQHLINAARRLYVNNSPVFEDKWLDEGLSHIAEELLFYHEAGLAPRTNIGLSTLQSSSKIATAYTLEMSGNQTRYRQYLLSPTVSSPYAADDSLTTRGAAWSFLRYALDRLNATDGFTAGNGQVVTGAGNASLTAGAVSAEYSFTVVNTSLVAGSTTAFTLRAPPAPSASIVPVDAPALSRMAVADVPDDPNVLQRDVRYESRMRQREREVLTPMMSGARAWYATQRMPAPSFSRSAVTSQAVSDADGTVLFKLANATTAGITNIQSVLNNDLAGFVRDWSVSQAVDDVAALTTQYQQRSWNWHSIFPAFPPGSYPLQVSTLSGTGVFTVNGTVTAGGAAFYRLTVPANGTVIVSLSAPSGAVNPNLQLVIVRTK